MCGSGRHSSVNHRRSTRTGCHTPFMGNLEVQTAANVSSFRGGIQCLNCGFQQHPSVEIKDINYCQNCGTELQRCPISKNQFREGDEFAQCPDCLTLFHYHHLRAWLIRNPTCPLCKSELYEIISGTVGEHAIGYMPV